MSKSRTPRPRFDRAASGMLAAFRDEEQIPEALYDRVWSRVEADARVGPTRAQQRPGLAQSPWPRRFVVGALAAAAAVALAWVSHDGLQATGVAAELRQAPALTPHQTQPVPHSGDARARSGVTGQQRPTVPAEPAALPPAASVTPGLQATDPAATPAARPGLRVGEREPSVRKKARRQAHGRRSAAPPILAEPAAAAPRSASGLGPSPLGEEIALIERARKALLRDMPAAASKVLQTHAARFPNGAMAQERRALAAIAGCQSEGPQAGQTRARSFLRDHPTAALADRVRRACDTP